MITVLLLIKHEIYIYIYIWSLSAVTELGILANAGAPIQFLELASIYDNFLGILLMYLMLCEQIPLYSTLGYVYPPDLLLAPKSYVSSLFFVYILNPFSQHWLLSRFTYNTLSLT